MILESQIEILQTKETLHDRYYFATRESRDLYYTNKTIRTIKSGKYKNKGDCIYISGNVEQFKGNYLRFYNKQKDAYDKSNYVYCFVNDVYQVNRKTIQLSIVIDVIGSFLFDMNLNKQVFVERLSPNTDNIGDNLVPEFYELGEMRPVYTKSVHPCKGKYGYLVVSAECPKDGGKFETGTSVSCGVWCGVWYFFFAQEDYVHYNNFIDYFNQHGHIDAIIAVAPFPHYPEFDKLEMETATPKVDGCPSANYKQIKPDSISSTLNESYKICKISTLKKLNNGKDAFSNAYIPKCKKLLTYPYTVLCCENIMGGSQFYRLENLGNENYLTLKTRTTIGYPATIEARLYNYEPTAKTTTELDRKKTITLSGWGICSWVSDYSKTWLAQNDESIKASRLNTLESFNSTDENLSRSYNTSTNIANRNYQMGQTISNIDYNIGQRNNFIQDVQNTVNTGRSAIGALTSGSVGGVVGGLANTAIDAGVTYLQNGVQESNLNDSYTKSLLSNRVGYQNSIDSATLDFVNSQNSNETSKNNALRSINSSVKAIQSFPSSAKGDTSGNKLDLCDGMLNFYVSVYQGDDYFMNRIDRYFQMFGYLQNDFMKVNTAVFRNHGSFDSEGGCNYIKTIGADFVPKLTDVDSVVPPLIYVNAFNSVFDSGIRFWCQENMEIENGYVPLPKDKKADVIECEIITDDTTWAEYATTES